MIGQTISHYRIVEKLGEGGMGVVFKAEDAKLERTVALKFLAAHLLHDEEAKQRFLREAKAAAALHHPNICTVHEIDEVEGKTFLAMTFLQGDTLEDRIAKGPLPLKDALDIARQVAEGLEAAHAGGIVHRDIKPANVLVSPQGRATIMDFGLARLTEASKLTRADQTVGTTAYMSPEQIQGSEVDHRTDVWAMGCVLYEMVAGLRPFKGQYDQALLYEIVNQEPEPLTGVRAGVPMELEFIVGKCLAKDPGDRYQHASEITVDLRTLAEKFKSGRSTILRSTNVAAAIPSAAPRPLAPGDGPQPNSTRLWQVLFAGAVLALLGLLAVYSTQNTPQTPEKPLVRFSLAPEGLSVDAVELGRAETISPNGRYILYVAETDGESNLWLRSLRDETARKLPGTAGAGSGFWSPDSSSIGFTTRPGLELKRISIGGGDPITLCKLPTVGPFAFMGGSWSPDGERIIFSSTFQLYEVAARGGSPRLLFERADYDSPEAIASYPRFLPAGEGPPAIVYTVGTSNDKRVAVMNLETGVSRELGPGSRPVYARDGFLIHGGNQLSAFGLWALPFSRETLEATGDAFPISTEGLAASVSDAAVLAFLESPEASAMQTLVWRSRTGEALKTLGQPQPNIGGLALSPDGERIAVSSDESGNRDIWIHDLNRSIKTRLTFDDLHEYSPAWSPSGTEIAYRIEESGGDSSTLARRAADGTGEPVTLAKTGVGVTGLEWSRDGRYLVYHQSDPEKPSHRDIFYLEFLDGDGASEPKTFLAAPADQSYPRLSPDSRFVAYASDESGRYEVYLRPFPSGDGKWQVSVNSGNYPRWRGDGGELYYTERGVLMAVPISTETGVTLGQRQALFESPLVSGVGSERMGYDVSADGQRFVTIAPVESDKPAAPPTIRIVMNWYEEFRDRERPNR